MKCAIIGAAGFIGRRLGAMLAARGHVVTGYDREDSGADAGFEMIRCDAGAGPVVLTAGTDAVFYLAQSPRYREFPRGGDDLFVVNVVGALRAALAAVEAGARFFCYASTGNVYAPSFDAIDESHPVQRDSGYAVSKLAAEDALKVMSASGRASGGGGESGGGGGMRITCVRLFGVFGPGQRGMLVPTIIARVRENAAVQIERHPTDRSEEGLRISLTFVDDAGAALEQLAEAVLAGRGVPFLVNLAAPEAVSIRALAETAGRALDMTPRFEIVDRARRSDLIADVTRLRSIIDPALTPFEEAVRRTIAADG